MKKLIILEPKELSTLDKVVEFEKKCQKWLKEVKNTTQSIKEIKDIESRFDYLADKTLPQETKNIVEKILEIKESFRQKRLLIDRKIKAEKEEKIKEELSKIDIELDDIYDNEKLMNELKSIELAYNRTQEKELIISNLKGKSLKNYENIILDSIDLLRIKISKALNKIIANRKKITEENKHLFNDFEYIALEKNFDDILKLRIIEHEERKKAERVEAERVQAQAQATQAQATQAQATQAPQFIFHIRGSIITDIETAKKIRSHLQKYGNIAMTKELKEEK